MSRFHDSQPSNHFPNINLFRFTYAFPFYLSTILFFAYLPNLLQHYAWSDDYPAMVSPEASALHAIKDYRPLHGFIIRLGFANFDSLNTIWVIRLFGLLLLIAIANLSYVLIQETIENKILSLCTVILIYQTPPFLNSVYWSMGASTVLTSLILSVFAYRSLFKGNRILGFVLLTMSFLIYPLGTWSGTSLFLLTNILAKKPIKQFLKTVRFLVLATMPSAFLALLIGSALLEFINESPNARTQIADYSVKENSLWLFTRMIPQSFRPFNISSPSNSVALLQVIFLVGVIFLGVFYRKGFTASVDLITKMIMALLFLLLPGFIIGYNQIEPRFFVGTSIVVVGILIVILPEIFGLSFTTKSNNLIRFTSNLFFGTLVAGAVFLNNSFFEKHIEARYQSTTEFLFSQLKHCEKDKLFPDVLILDRTLPWESRPYLGMLSQETDLASPWVPANAVTLIWREISKSEVNIRSGSLILPNESERVCIINLDSYR